MGITVGAAHQIVSLAQQGKYLLHYLDAARHIARARLHGLCLGQKEEIQTLIHRVKTPSFLHFLQFFIAINPIAIPS